MGIKGTKTEQNLLKAFAGESQARNRYTYFASVAKKEGFEQIKRHLPRDRREREGARQGLLRLSRGRAGGDHGHLPGRQDRHHRREPAGRRRGREGGVEHALPRLRRRGQAGGLQGRRRLVHARSRGRGASTSARYRKLLANVQNKQVFKREQPVKWHCRNCGYVHEGPEAPKIARPASTRRPTTSSGARPTRSK